MDQKLQEKLKELNIIEGSDGKYIMTLTRPITFSSVEYKEITLDEPRAKHIRKMPASPIADDILKIGADLCHQPDSFIDLLSLKDSNRLAEFFSAFN